LLEEINKIVESVGLDEIEEQKSYSEILVTYYLIQVAVHTSRLDLVKKFEKEFLKILKSHVREALIEMTLEDMQ